MSDKDQLQKDYETFNQDIKNTAEQQIKNIREKASAIKKEALQKGEAVELSLMKEK